MQSDEDIVQAIINGTWWQGAVVSAKKMAPFVHTPEGADFWVVASQTCNLYNIDLERVPSFEILAAKCIDTCSPQMSKGDHPRTLHIEAENNGEKIFLEILIQKRAWLDRKILAQVGAPDYYICDTLPEHDNDWLKKQWLDLFSGWLGRSYTRVALPDEFNLALETSKIKEIIDKKLTKRANELYGIYFSLAPDCDNPSHGLLGLMPPPYLLSIMLVTYPDAETDILGNFQKQLFTDLIENGKDDANGKRTKLTRATYAGELGIRIIKQGVTLKTTGEVTLQELKEYIRYSLVDHHSNSQFAANP